MLLQIICNLCDEYQLNTNLVQDKKLPKRKITLYNNLAANKHYGYSPISKYEEVKGKDSDEDSKVNDKSAGLYKSQKADKKLIEAAKRLFYTLSNKLPDVSRASYLNFNPVTGERIRDDYTSLTKEVQTIKLSSILVYLSRILQPIFSNYLVFLPNLKKINKVYPNMGVSEKRVVGSKLVGLLEFIKEEEKNLKNLFKNSRESRNRGTREDSRRYEETLQYENIIQQESTQIEFLKSFVMRCIISIDFLEEISKNNEDFSKAFSGLSDKEKRLFETYKFYDLLNDIGQKDELRSFIKKLLEVKAEE